MWAWEVVFLSALALQWTGNPPRMYPTSCPLRVESLLLQPWLALREEDGWLAGWADWIGGDTRQHDNTHSLWIQQTFNLQCSHMDEIRLYTNFVLMSCHIKTVDFWWEMYRKIQACSVSVKMAYGGHKQYATISVSKSTYISLSCENVLSFTGSNLSHKFLKVQKLSEKRNNGILFFWIIYDPTALYIISIAIN